VFCISGIRAACFTVVTFLKRDVTEDVLFSIVAFKTLTLYLCINY